MAERERGAVAVEFALVLPILVLLLAGILDYGVWYSDSLSVKHAAYEGARWGATAAGEPAPAGCSESSLAGYTACIAKDRASTAGGQMLVKVDAQGPWRAGNELLVCTMAKVAVTGLSPLPSDGIVRSLVVTRIEEDAGPAEDGSGYADTPLNGQSWSWCA